MNYIVSFFALVLLSGCTITQPYADEYSIKIELMQQHYNANACRDKSLKISQAFSKNTLMTQQMKYTQGSFKEYLFNRSQWSQNPNSAITQEMLKSVRESQLFKSVHTYKSRSKSDYVLESNIEEFVQHFDKELKSSYASVVITLSLVDAKSLKVINSKTLQEKIETDEVNAKGGVAALNMALSKVLARQNIWLNEVCR